MKSLRWQVITAILLVLGLGLAALLIVSGSQMTQMTTEAFISKQEVATVTVANILGASRLNFQQSYGSVQGFLSAVSDEFASDLTIISTDGSVLATTYKTLPSSVSSPELTTALNGHLVASSIRDDHLYIAAPIIHDNAILLGVVWVDTSLAPVQSELQGRWVVLIGATIATLVFACVVGWWLAARIVRPLAAIQVVAEEMAAGELDVRASVSDMSHELASLGRAFNRMAEQVEVMLARQTDFVANASHELRSPLAAIRLRAEALANGSVSGERAQQYAAEINSETVRLAQMVADLLKLSKADSRSFTPPTEPINVADELMASIRAIRPAAIEKNQRLETNIAEDLPELYIYPTDLRIMVNNLLDNAVKYTPENGFVSLSACATTEDVIIEVRDTGDGIPAQDLPHVTERFFRVDRAHNRSVAGTGLGLSLVLATVQQYGGTLTLESAGVPGQGTRAILRLKQHPD